MSALRMRIPLLARVLLAIGLILGLAVAPIAIHRRMSASLRKNSTYNATRIGKKISA